MKRRHHDTGLSSPPSLDMGDTLIKNKSRACAECKRHKIKCQIDAGQPKCKRCLRQDLPCVTSTTLQKFVDDDTKWKVVSEAQTTRLEVAMGAVLRQLHLPELASYDPARQALETEDGTRECTRENSREPDLEEGSMVSAPTDALYELTKLRNLRSNQVDERRTKTNQLESDLISRGALQLADAESLFESFSHSMNQLLWGGIVVKHSNLESVRHSSSLLSAAILTVSSIHIPGRSCALHTCYDDYMNLVSRSIIKKRCTLDDIRGLCVGAFWLPEMSWRLAGHAIRLATEMGIHKSFQKMVHGESEHFERAELWYLLYVLDHQFSTTYGRPATICEDMAITEYETFLRYPTAMPGDVRLMSQVALFILHEQLFRQFGTGNERPIDEEDFEHLRRYNIELDQWRSVWQPRLVNSQHVQSYPSKGVTLHYYFAKFQFNSLALRAINPGSSVLLSSARKESANLAISSAMSTLAFILDEPDLRNNIIGIPLFAHTMLAFSAVFLLKVALKWNLNSNAVSEFPTPRPPSASKVAGIYIISDVVEDLVDRIISLLHSSVASEKHLTIYIARGLSKMLSSFRLSMSRLGNGTSQEFTQESAVETKVPEVEYAIPNVNLSHSCSGVDSFGMAGGTLDDGFGFSLNEAWQDFPATTLDFLTSQWQASTSIN